MFLIFLACKRCWSDLAEESRRAECGLGVLFLCISRLDRCLLRHFRGCGQVEQMHLGSIFVCMVQQGKFLGGRCGGGHAWRDVCQTQCAALPDAPCCDGWCSALRSPMHRAAMILRNPFASLLLLLSDMCRSGTAKAEACQRRLAMLPGVSDKSCVWGGEALWAKKRINIITDLDSQTLKI